MRLDEWWRRLERLWNRDAHTRDLEEEMRIHVQMRAAQIQRNSQVESVPTHEAVTLAQRRFGNTTTLQQRSRDAWGFVTLNELASDLRYATRHLLKQRSVSATVVVVMAIGIGSSTAMFSAADAAILRPLPFDNPGQLVTASARVPHEDDPRDESLVAIAGMTDLFQSVAAYGVGGLNLSDEDHPLRLRVGVVTTNFFATLGVRAAYGRLFDDAEGTPGARDVAILSDGLWKRAFGSQSIAGLRITLNAKTFEVVGVMPPSFTFPQQSDVWIPMSVPLTNASFEPFRDYVDQTNIARLANGVTPAHASVQLLERFRQRRLSPNAADTAKVAEWVTRVARIGGLVKPLHSVLARERSTQLYVLLGATTLLLLVGCANVTNLLLAQAASRRREIAVRQVLGATRVRIVRQLLTESVLLSLSGAVLGLMLAVALSGMLQAFMPEELLGISEVRVDWRVAAFAVSASVVAGITFGLWPAFGSARPAPVESIKQGNGHGTTAGWSGGLRRVLVGGELALTVMLLIGAGITLRSLQKISTRDVGIRTTNVGTLEIAFASTVQRDARFRTLRDVTARLQAMPGIVAAGISKTLPLATAGDLLVSIKVAGVAREQVEAMQVTMNEEFASSGYFAALQIPVLTGRVFSTGEDASKSTSAVINATTARLYWPGRSAVGQTFMRGKDTLTVTGVVADVINRFDDGPVAQIYLPTGGTASSSSTLVARSTAGNDVVLQQMMQAVREVAPSQPVFNVRMMDDVHAGSIATQRTSTQFMTAFAMVALLLSCLGVYAVVSYGLSQRQRELGIRSALGASGSSLLALVSGEMLCIALGGVGLGVAGAWASSWVLQRVVYEIDVRDTATFVVVPLALLLVAALATLVPAARTFRVNPADVMRAD
ncbi:MAG: ADOP family duplicated permease [Gemmatimonas sp.]